MKCLLIGEHSNVEDIIIDMKHCDFILLSGGEILELPEALSRRERDLRILFGAILGLTTILLFSIIFIRFVETILGIFLLTTGVYIYLVKEKKILSDMAILNAYFQNHKEIAEKDVIIFATNDKNLVLAKSIIGKYKKRDIENVEIIFAFSKKIFIIGLLSDTLLTLGIALIILRYLFISILHFLILGLIFLYVILKLISKIIDIVMLL